MTIYQLIYLSETARCGSISQAAKNLHISQPALSESIKELEKEYSVQIFSRSNKGITLTEEGEEFISHVRLILNNIEDMNHRFITESDSTHVKISSTKLPFIYQAFKDYYKEIASADFLIELSFLEGLSPEVFDNVYTGKANLGFVLIAESSDHTWKGYMNNYDVKYHYIQSFKPRIVMRKGHPLCKSENITDEQLNAYPIIYTYEHQEHVPNNNMGYRANNLERFSKILYIYNQNTALNFVAHSDAICIMACTAGLSSLWPELSTVPYSSTKEIWNAYWIKQKKYKLTKEYEYFLELIKCTD